MPVILQVLKEGRITRGPLLASVVLCGVVFLFYLCLVVVERMRCKPRVSTEAGALIILAIAVFLVLISRCGH